MRRVPAAFVAAIAAAVSFESAQGLGRPGLTPVPCPSQQWAPVDPAIRTAAGAKAFSGHYSGGVYHIEIPDKWNGELMLSAHGFRGNGGAHGSRLEVQPPAIREHLIDDGFAWAASSYRCNGYVPGIGLRGHDGADGPVHEVQWRHSPAPRLPHGHVDGRSRHAARHARVPDVVRRRARDVSRGSRAVRLLHGQCGGSGSDHRSPASEHGHARCRISTRIEALLGTPPNYTEKGRQLASVQIQLSGRTEAVRGGGTRRPIHSQSCDPARPHWPAGHRRRTAR